MENTSLQKEIAHTLLRINAIGFSPKHPITFKSGILSPVYVDNRKLPSYPWEWNTIINGFHRIIMEQGIKFDMLAGIETAGIPHSAALASLLKVPSVFIRKEVKDHGTKKRIEGGDVKGKTVLLIEDLVTFGTSSLSGVKALRDEGAKVNDCLAIVTYSFPESQKAFSKAKVKLHALTPFSVALEAAIASKRSTKAQAEEVKKWMKDPHKWTARHKK